MIDIRLVSKQLEGQYGLVDPVCKDLNTIANDAIEVRTADGHFALKLYNPASRTKPQVQWEIDLTLHLIDNGAPIAKPVQGRDGYIQVFTIGGQERAAVLFEWAPGEKPKAEPGTYVLVGRAAALIHTAADTFTPSSQREKYDLAKLIDDQLRRMKQPLVESGQWQRVFDLTERLRKIMDSLQLDWGVCHMDLTLDNVHRHGDTLTVFDLDSAGECWRATEPWGVKNFSEDYFQSWLEGYRSVRSFSETEEKAVSLFVIIEDIRNVVWKLGLAKSSRGKPLMQTSEIPGVVDGWLAWERDNIKG